MTFDANVGVMASTAIEQVTGMTYKIPVAVPTMEGAVVNGWWSEQSGGVQITVNTQVTLTRAHTLYAH